MPQLLKTLLPFILLAVLVGIDIYAFQAYKQLVVASYIRRLLKWGYWLFTLLVIVLLMVSVNTYARSEAGQMSVFHIVITTAFVCLLLVKLITALLMLGEDAYRLTLLPWRHALVPRHHAVAVAAAVLSGLMVLVVVHGVVWLKYSYKMHHVVVRSPYVPQAFDGFRIVQLSDLHAGSLTSPRSVQRGIDLVNAQHADLFVFTGDIVNNTASELAPWIPYLSQIRAPYGQYSVLGNHDYGDYQRWPSPQAKIDNLEQLKQYQADMGWRLLMDEHVTLQRDSAQIVLLGVQNWGHRFVEIGDLERALQGVDTSAYKILLSHDPSHWEYQVKDHPVRIDLQLAGHTHGFQFGIENPWFKWSPVQWLYPRWAGIFDHHGRHLYVNRGFGFLGFSGRVGIRPEITVIELRHSAE